MRSSPLRGALAALALAPGLLAAQQAAAPTQAGHAHADAALSRYAGTFYAPLTGAVIRTAVRDGRLSTTLPREAALEATAPGHFRAAGMGELSYVMKDSLVRELQRIEGKDTTLFLAMNAVAPTAEELEAYAGRYRAAQGGARMSLMVRDGALVATRDSTTTPLAAAFHDAFVHPTLGTLVFRRDGAGAIASFGAWGAGNKDVRFVREK